MLGFSPLGGAPLGATSQGAAGPVQTPMSIGATSSPTTSIVRGAARSIPSISTVTTSIVRFTSRVVAALSSSASSLTRSDSKSFTNNATATSAFTFGKSYLRSMSNNATATAALVVSKSYLRSLSNNVSAVLSLIKPSSKPLTNAITSVVSVQKSMTRSIANALSSAVSLTRSSPKVLTKSVAATSALAFGKSYLRSMSSNISSVLSFIKSDNKAITIVTSSVASVRKAIARLIYNYPISVATIVKSDGKVITKAVSSTAALVTGKSFLRTMSNNISVVAAAAKSIPQAFTNAMSVLASFSKSFSSGTSTTNKSLQAVANYFSATELVPNGTFDSNITGWNGDAGVSLAWNSGKLRVTTIGGGGSFATGNFGMIPGRNYVVSLEVTKGTPGSGYLDLYMAGTRIGYLENGTITFKTFCYADSGIFFYWINAAGEIVDLDNISVKEANVISSKSVGKKALTYATKPWTPDQLGANLFAWFDSADYSTITESGGAVAQWSDKSGNGNHVTQATAGYKPTYSVNGFTGQASLYFAGDDYLNNTATNHAANAKIQVFAVMRPTTGIYYYNRVVSFSNGSNLDYQGAGYIPINRNVSSTTEWSAYSGGGGGMGSLAVLADNTNGILGSILDASANHQMFINGVGSTPVASAFPTVAQDHMALGTAANVSGAPPTESYYGHLSEVIIVTGTITSTDRQNIEGYLAWKWNLAYALDGSQPYKNERPLLSTANTATRFQSAAKAIMQAVSPLSSKVVAAAKIIAKTTSPATTIVRSVAKSILKNATSTLSFSRVASMFRAITAVSSPTTSRALSIVHLIPKTVSPVATKLMTYSKIITSAIAAVVSRNMGTPKTITKSATVTSSITKGTPFPIIQAVATTVSSLVRTVNKIISILRNQSTTTPNRIVSSSGGTGATTGNLATREGTSGSSSAGDGSTDFSSSDQSGILAIFLADDF